MAFPVLLFRSRFPVSSPYSRPGFPCHLSGSVYLAFCLFPFVLPCFAPTAVPQVLTFFHLSISLRCFPLLPLSFVRFRLGSDYSASVSSFPFIPASLTVVLSGAYLSAFPSACFHASLPILLLSFPAIPFSAFLFRITGATSAAGLLFPARPFPLAFALGSVFWAE